MKLISAARITRTRNVAASCLAGFVLLAGIALAEDKHALEAIEKCEADIVAGREVAAIAKQIAEMRNITLEPQDRFRGMACLKQHFGERYYFDLDGGRFISETEDRYHTARRNAEAMERERAAHLALEKEAAAEREARLAAAREEAQKQLEHEEARLLQARRADELQERLLQACYDGLAVNPLDALTHKECQLIFIANGFDRPTPITR